MCCGGSSLLFDTKNLPDAKFVFQRRRRGLQRDNNAKKEGQ
jgi:hypothetical protein